MLRYERSRVHSPFCAGTLRAVLGVRAPVVVASVIARIALAIGAVFVATAVLVASAADLATAVSVILLVVVGASALGYLAGLTASFVGFATLNYYFTEPRHTFSVERTDDLVALVVFVLIAIVVATGVARLNDLRMRSRRGQQEALLRLSFIDRLSSGDEPGAVLDAAAQELVDVFDLAWCDIVTDTQRHSAHHAVRETGVRTFAYDGLTLTVGLNHKLTPGDAYTLEALGASLATTLERMRLDAERREQRLRAELDQSRAGFLTAVTHDLRTPLASIKAGTAALLRGNGSLSPDERRLVLELAHDEAARLERLVTNVLELTRIRGGGLHPEPIAVNAADLAQLAVQRLRRLAAQRTICLEIDPDLPPLYGDPVMLEHVVVNLLENALNYSPADTPIEIRAVQLGSVQEIQVVDHGPGVPIPDRDRVFEEFVRLDRQTAPRGTGLGLAIVRAFVGLNRGTVRCEPTPGGGATFLVDLPTESGGVE